MKIPNKILKPLVKNLAGVSSDKVRPDLANILIRIKDGLFTATAANTDSSLTYQIPLALQDFSCCVEAKRLNTLLQNVSDDSESDFTVNENYTVNVNINKSKYKLNGTPSENFPKYEIEESAKSFKVNSKVFFDLLKRTSFCVNPSQAETTYNSVQIEVDGKILYLAGTDRIRCAIASTELEEDFGKFDCLVSRAGIARISPFLSEIDEEVTVYVGKNNISVKNSAGFILYGLQTGSFPPFRKLLVEYKKSVQVDNITFSTALNRLQAVIDRVSLLAEFHFSKNGLIIKSVAGEGEEPLDDIKTDEFSVGFNISHFLDFITVVKQPFFIKYADGGKRFMLEEVDPKYKFIYVLNPTRIERKDDKETES